MESGEVTETSILVVGNMERQSGRGSGLGLCV